MNKKLVLSLVAICAFCARSVAAGSLQDTVDAMNYHLSNVMKPFQTYAGVLADAQDKEVMIGPRGLIAGLTLGVANLTLGTNLGGSKLPVHQYIIRLDQPYNGAEASIITIIQGGGELLPAGIACFVVTQGTMDGRIFSARVVPAKTPEAYGRQGLEEARLQAGRTSPPK